jgi:CRISPR-associated endonuclease/helicase Cas3
MSEGRETIRLDGVAVPRVGGDYLGFEPYDHQKQAQEVIENEDEFFAVNTSPTGSGKTYSWLKPALDEGIDTIAVFPTNALIADQLDTACELVESEYPRANVVEVTAETTSKWKKEARTNIDKGKALRRNIYQELESNHTTIVLTNPDTFTLLRKDMYHHGDAINIPTLFDMIVFDEFHLADVRQTDILLFLVDELNALSDIQSRANRFYFLSATPDESSNYRSVEERIQEDIGEEAHSIRADALPLSEADVRYTGVMPEVNLKLRKTQTFRTSDKLLDEENVDEFVEFCREEQTVIMLDGVHEVDLVYEALSDELDEKVHRITGFNDEEAREKIESFDVLVSNAAVEVGLDFQPERLIFSASNASKLIQRLGRLRKLDDRDKPHEAWCYVPGAVKAKVESELTNKGIVTRSGFESSVKRAFDDEVDLSSYSTRWSDVEAYHHVSERVDNVPSKEEREKTLTEGLQRIERHYYEPYGRSFEQEDLDRLLETTSDRLVEELRTYRGSGLQVMVRDNVADEMKLYNMLHLLTWGEVEFYEPSEFCSRLSEEEEKFYRAYKDYSVGYCEFFGKISSDDAEDYPGRNVKFKSGNNSFHSMIEKKDRVREPQLLTGLDIKIDHNEAPRIKNLGHLRDELKEAERLVYAFPGDPSMNEARYGFGDFFFVYRFHRQGGDCSITFGTTALFMHCLVQDKEEENAKDRDWTWN